MRLALMLVSTAVLVIGLQAVVAANDDPHEQAIAAIRKLGGDARVDSTSPLAPVAVTLAGSADPEKCLPYLKDVRNLHRCDL